MEQTSLDSLKEIRFVHFNDVYEIVPNKKSDVSGGAPRFVTAVQKVQREAKEAGVECITVFSGDLLGPSSISSHTQGDQMVYPFQMCNVDVAMIGNHDLDFGVEKMQDIIQQTSSHFNSTNKNDCQWIVSNLVEKENKETGVGGLAKTCTITRRGKKFGFIGIIERAWVDTFKNIDRELEYQNYKNVAWKLVRNLRREKCDYVIALTHMRKPHDVKLAQQVPGIDLILGGHDHFYAAEFVQTEFNASFQVPIVKSGCDFQDFSLVTLKFNEKGNIDDQKKPHSVSSYNSANGIFCKVDQYRITSEYEPQKEVEKFVQELDQKYNELDYQIACFAEDLDCSTESLRTSETKMGNFLAHIFRTEYDADFSIITSGSVRLNETIEAGPFYMSQLKRMLPFEDRLTVLKVSGEVLRQVLENAVSKYPMQDGRWPMISGFRFSFNADKPAGERVTHLWKKDGSELSRTEMHSLVVPIYCSNGNDGFQMLKQVEHIHHFEDLKMTKDIVMSYFRLCDKQYKPKVLEQVYMARKFEFLAHEMCSEGRFRVLRPTIVHKIHIEQKRQKK